MARVSVILATRNRAAYLGLAVTSVRAQTWRDWELIVSDDGSTDGTRAVMDAFSFDSRVRYLYQEPRGVSAARNHAIRHARGEYFAFLDDDDVFLPDKLRKQVQALDRHRSAGLVAGGHHVIDQRGTVLATDEPWKRTPELTADHILLGNQFSSNSVLVRRSMWDRTAGFDEALTVAEDWDAWLALALHGCRMRWIREVVCGVRRHAHHASSDPDRMRESELRILDRVYMRDDLPPAIARLRGPAYARVYLRSALRRYAQGELVRAATNLRRAIDLDPGVTQTGAEEFIAAIATRASGPDVACPRSCVHEVLSTLPESAARLRRHRAEILARVAMRRTFTYYGDQQWRSAQRAAIEALCLAPQFARNRGLVKVGILATLRAVSS